VVDPLNPVPETFRVNVFKLPPNVIPDIVDAANLETAIAALALISALTIVPSAIIVDVIIPVPNTPLGIVPVKFPAGRLVSDAPEPLNVVAVTVPVTVSAVDGLVVPIPTLPPLSM
jgi:hypothetical protein